ncbi:MAG TPA: hypothetical protein VNA16_09790, partial [Abditibacteriaceae bacterium]|nr:hypothetical protein [Abditibacteriaceae bacterium]
SLPLPRDVATTVSIDHAASALQPVAWWKRHEVPRRALALVVDDNGVPETLRLRDEDDEEKFRAGVANAPARWTVSTRTTKEKLDFVAHRFADIAALRGVPAEECTTVEFELLLSFGARTVAFQYGATGPQGGPYFWQNVQIDTLWQNKVAQAVRVGGIIYNEDTYLWADVYLLLFSNGVAHAAAHFVTTKLHIEGYDFHGLPFISLSGEGLVPREASTPADGHRFDLGSLSLNLEDSSLLSSEEFPGRLVASEGAVLWYPVSRTFNPQVETAGEQEWAAGFARTARFQFSLSDAPPLIARYRAPSWWYAASGEPWPWGYLPVHGRYDRLGALATDYIRGEMKRGRFDAGSAGLGNDGDSGVGMMQNYYHTGRPEVFEDALAYCYFWADIMVDHRDFTVHQWLGGWPWKTCAYSKFRDVLFGYLETGDPYLLDSAEMVAESYWVWFRTNWPRCTIGRDAFEVGAWALLWRFCGTEHARERTEELVRMIRTVLDSRGTVGGQMGAGPHPGYLPSLYMTGVCMSSLLDVAEAEAEVGDGAVIEGLIPMLQQMDEHYNRDDVELFPSSFGLGRAGWEARSRATWSVLALRLATEMARLEGAEDAATRRSLARANDHAMPSLEDWAKIGRLGNNLIYPLYHDALLLGARVHQDGIALCPLGEPSLWPVEQTIETPFGLLRMTTEVQGAKAVLRFSAEAEFPVIIEYGGEVTRTGSRQSCELAWTP